MTSKFTVVGAGMAGLLAAVILRDECDLVIESQEALPNNHRALLRFRSAIVGDTVNIPFRAVDVIKTVETTGNPVKDAISYSMKTNGSATLRSLVSANGKLEQRFIAPDDLVQRLASKVTSKIKFGERWQGDRLSSGPVISTLPMPTLMKILGYEGPRPEFKSVLGFVATAKLRDCNFCSTIYLPSYDRLPYRASVTGDQLIVEYAFPNEHEKSADKQMSRLMGYPKELFDHLDDILRLFGLNAGVIIGKPEIKKQHYAKILPVEDELRKRFMLWATETHNVYSLGRFATWRPGLMTDDLIKDLRVIQRLASDGTYDTKKDF